MKKIIFCVLTVLNLMLIGGLSQNQTTSNTLPTNMIEKTEMKDSDDNTISYLSTTKKAIKEENIELSNDDLEQVNEIILQCENNLSDKGNSVIEELSNQINDYTKRLKELETNNSQNYEQIQNIKALIDDLSLMLNQYIAYTSNEMYEVSDSNSIQTYMVVADPDALLSLSYPAAHAAIVAYFSNSGYTLSAELLTHMKSNNSYDSVYKPVNSNIVYENEVFRNLAYNSSQKGTGEFSSGDLYMAIHLFNYSKSLNNTAIVLTDRYDFEFSTSYDSFMTQAAVNMMASAQNSGYLTPYYVVVEYNNSDNLNNNSNIKTFPVSSWRYSEAMETLGKGESIIYTVSFPSSGYRNIQTFGYNDSYLTIQTSNGNYLTSNDDGGYEKNAFLNYYFNSGEIYRIILRFYSNCYLGNVRVAITPSTYEDYESISALDRTWSLFKTYYKNVEVNNEVGKISMYLLKPAITSSFTIQATKKNNYVDTYLYYIDPRRADTDKDDSNKPEYLKSCIANDDGGDNLQAKLSIGKHECNIPYLIVAGTFSSSINGNYYLDINGLDSYHGMIIL